HAGGDPHNGRSALDAVELMNVGANYLREHIISDARMHYIITEGGKAPNIVPERAQVWYFVRAPKVHQLNDIVARLHKVARGAAMMTETEVEIVCESGVYNMLPNEILAQTLYEASKELPPLEWSAEDIAFAQEMISSLPPEQRSAAAERLADKVDTAQPLAVTLHPPQGKGTVMTGSTDVADVSWQVPTVMFGTACHPWAAPGHSWMVTACSGHSIGHKGMLYAGKMMAVATLKLLSEPDLISKAAEEFTRSTADSEYKPFGDVPLPKFTR
ncbi:MAG: peptidase dimerization domain-containing protein, partial [Symbiobacteriaceae bacterium]|nr:peptidase dimerization domain-containing protein [Symbiobacteriaceae bacterium]